MIHVAPQYVWAVLDDVQGWPTWMPAMQNLQVDILTAGPPRRGYQFRMQGKVVRADLEVIGFGPLERTTKFRIHLPPLVLRGTNRCLLIPVSRGVYRLDRVDHLQLPGPVVKFLDSTQRMRFEKLASDFLLSLKETVLQRATYAGTRRFHR